MSRFGTPAQTNYARLAGTPQAGSAGYRNSPATQQTQIANAALLAQQHRDARLAGLDKLHRFLATEGSLHGGLYMDTSPSNRLVLSLKSGLAQDVDFALERVLLAASLENDVISFREYPSLLEALAGIVHRVADLSEGLTACWQNMFASDNRQQTIRQAAEAALAIRLLAQSPTAASALRTSRYLKIVIVAVLETFNRMDATEELVEIVCALLDVLDVVAPTFVLLPPDGEPVDNRSGQEDDEMEGGGKVSAAQAQFNAARRRLVPSLLPLCHSSDRALILGAFRCLATLASSPEVIEKNEPVFTFSCSQESSDAKKLIDRAVELLTLPDPDLSSAILDLLYSYTIISSNADSMCGRPDIGQILRLLTARLAASGQREDFESEPFTKASQRTQVQNSLQRELEKCQVLPTKLPLPELQVLAFLPEPQRTLCWLRWVFEEIPEGEITQVNLWTAYREQFDPSFIAQLAGGIQAPAILSASDVIKHSSDAYPHATPQVVEVPEKRFIIKGLKLRDRNELVDSLRKLWMGQPKADEPYSHRPPGLLHAGTTPSNDILVAGLRMLIHTQATLPQGSLAKRFGIFRAMTATPIFHIHFTRWTTTVPVGQSAALLAATTLRNLARAVKATCRPEEERSRGLGGTNLLDLLSGQATVAKDSTWKAVERKDTETEAPREKATAEATNATPALLGLESELLQIATSCRHLCPQLTEILQVIGDVREDMARGQQVKRPYSS